MVAMGACEKLRVAAASLCVLAAVEELRVGRERALDKQRVTDLEAMVVRCRLCGREFRTDLQMFSSESQSRCFALLSNDAASAFAAEDKLYKYHLTLPHVAHAQ